MLPNACPKPRKSKPKGVFGKHGKPLPRKTRLKSVNRKRGGHMFPKNVDEPYREWIRGRLCLLAGHTLHHWCNSPTRCCHVKSRGAGGADLRNIWPGCDGAHEEQHAIGIRAFQERWGLNLKTIARQLTEVYEAEKFPCP